MKKILKPLLPIEDRHDVIKIGSDYGGWSVPTDVLKPGALCYCAGTGEDLSFDLDLTRSFSCTVFSFDPTPAAIKFAQRPESRAPNLTFLPYGIWNKDTSVRFYAPRDPSHVSHSIKNLQRTRSYFTAHCRSIPSIMQTYSHDRVDLIKLDIEGAEYDVVDQLIHLNLLPKVLCVEFDQPMPMLRMMRLVKTLLQSHDLVAVDGWNFTFLRRGSAGSRPE